MKVTHPNPRISREDALKTLYEHPRFPKGARVASLKRVKGRWEAELDLKKTAAPAFLDIEDSDSEDTPKPPSSDSSDESGSDEPKPPKSDDDSDDGDKEEASIDKVFDLVKQIAEAVGVSSDLDKDEPSIEDILDEPVGPSDGPPGPDGPPAPPKPKGPAPRPLKPGETPPGGTPIGAPSFSSTKSTAEILAEKVATFNVSQVSDAPLSECERQIKDKYAAYGYKVKQMVESKDKDGNRVVRAQISKR